MKNILLKTGLLFLVLPLLSYSTQPLYAQFVKEKRIVQGNAINPDLHHPTNKKLIQATNSLQWSFVKDNISTMEARHPEIDGIALSMNGNFMRDYLILHGDKLWTDEDAQISTVSQVNWEKFTENFVILGLTDSVDFEFYNDSKWSIIIENAKILSKMINAGRLKGVLLDNENYFERMGSFPWRFNPDNYPSHTLEEVKAKSRERGKAFMSAIQSNVTYPLVVLNMFWFGDYWGNYEKETGRNALWMPFMDGMLEVASENNIFVDANEIAYYFTDTEMFTDIYNEFRQVRFSKYGAENLQEKYKTQVQIGHGIYPSLYYGRFKRWPHTYSDKENSTWWKHQIYNALLTSDKYVWIWSERWNWWEDGTGTLELPPDFVPIIKEVKDKLKKQESLGFDMVDHRPVWKENLTSPTIKWGVAELPKVIITSPLNKENTKSNLTIKTKTSGNAGKVEFFINSMRVGVDSVAPYSVKVFGLANGTYTIFARVFNNINEHTSSAPVIITAGGKSYGSEISQKQEQEIGGNNEIFNVGYGRVKKKDMTASVGQINGQSKKYASYQNIYDMIRGEVSGIQVNGNKITIQGSKSGISTEPLFVVNGMAVNSIDDISPQMVKTIDLLKGPSASIYGSRGANGVIFINLLGTSEQNK